MRPSGFNGRARGLLLLVVAPLVSIGVAVGMTCLGPGSDPLNRLYAGLFCAVLTQCALLAVGLVAGRPASLPLRRAVSISHHWMGAMLGGVLFVICLSGALSVLKPELRSWEMPTERQLAQAPIGLDDLLAQALAAFPEADSLQFDRPEAGPGPWHVQPMRSQQRWAGPAPTLSVAIAPKSKNDEDKLGDSIAKLLEEDQTLKVEKNTEIKQTLLTGMGELHLNIMVEKLKRRYGVDVVMSDPKVPYRETIRAKVEVEGKHKKQSGGRGQFGHVWIRFEPAPEDFVFSEEVFGGSVPRQYFPAVEKGLREVMLEGVLAGYPTIGLKATLYDGSYHNVDSSELAFKIAASLAFKKGIAMAKPVLLEPIMNVEVNVPNPFMGDIISDFNTKRGRVLGTEQAGRRTIIKAQVPLSEMYRYAIDLKSMTQGRGSFTMEFSSYEEVPGRLADDIIKKAKAEAEEEKK